MFAVCVCVYHGVVVGHFVQVLAALGVGERADPQAVGRVQLLHQVATAGLNHGRELQQTRRRQQGLDRVLPQLQPP